LARREERPHIADIFPALRGLIDLRCELLSAPGAYDDLDVAFCALPHTVAMEYVPGLVARGIKVVDLSADYRLRDPSVYEKWYKVKHKDPDNIAAAVYGLPEFYRDRVASARLVANPGCYPTGIELALAPLLKGGLATLDRPVIIDAKTGVSGGGRKPSDALHFPECNESLKAYKVGVHQHSGEIGQSLADIAGAPVPFCFVPHLAPMDRGIFSTCYVTLKQPAATEDLVHVFADFYRGEPFVRVREDDTIPGTKDVWGTNFCDIAVRTCGSLKPKRASAVRGVGQAFLPAEFSQTGMSGPPLGDMAVVMSCIDNLVKGASGQAVQNMNVMCGWEETAGLL